MRLEDDQDRDPQSTITPGRSEHSKIGETRGRRLVLGNPKITAPAQTSPTLERGFRLGGKPTAPAKSNASKPTVQPWIIMVGVGALLLLIVALLLRPSSASSALARANERLVNEYTKYLESKGSLSSTQIAEKRKDLVSRLQAVAWAKAVDDRTVLEKELTTLLFLDEDKTSPLYQYSVNQLKQLGPPKKRGAGL